MKKGISYVLVLLMMLTTVIAVFKGNAYAIDSGGADNPAAINSFISIKNEKIVLSVQVKTLTEAAVDSYDIYVAIYENAKLDFVEILPYEDNYYEIELGSEANLQGFLKNNVVKVFVFDNNLTPVCEASTVIYREKLMLLELEGNGKLIKNSWEVNSFTEKDWSEYNTLNIEIYSGKKTDDTLTVALMAPDINTGYYRASSKIDWEGAWKTLSFSYDSENPDYIADFEINRSPAGYKTISSINFWPNYGELTLSEEAEIIISRIYLTKEDELYTHNIIDCTIYDFAKEIKERGSVRPRVVTDADTFADTLSLIDSGKNEFLRAKKEELIEDAEKAYALTDEDIAFYLIDGIRMNYTANQALGTLAVAYKVTKDLRYMDKCMYIINEMASWKNWNPGHYLDVASAAYSVAIAYDILYNNLKDTEKTLIESTLMEKAIVPTLHRWERDKANAVSTNNWQIACSGGIGTAALAIADTVSEENAQLCNRLISHVIRTLPRGLLPMAPDGACPEGVGYWNTCTYYFFNFAMTMQNATGKIYGNLISYEGLDKTGYFPIASLGPNGTFNFSDSIVYDSVAYSQMFTIAKLYGQKELATYATLNTSRHKAWINIIAYRDELILDTESYTSAMEKLSKDIKYTGAQEIGYIRGNWTDKNSAWLAFKGGDNQSSHGDLDIGQFIYDSQGVRWFYDLGSCHYDVDGYWDNSENGDRWNYYKKRAEGHNTLVINPDEAPDQNPLAVSDITEFSGDENTSYGIIDMTEAYSSDVEKAMRGLALIDGRKNLLIRDEIVTRENSPVEIYSFLHTKAAITVNENDKSVAYLTSGGKKLRIDIISPAGAQWCIESPPAPLSSSPNPDGNYKNPDGTQYSVNSSYSFETFNELFVHLENEVDPVVCVLVRNIYTDEDDVPADYVPLSLSEWNKMIKN